MLLSCVLSSLAQAQVVADADYDIRHTFTFTSGADLSGAGGNRGVALCPIDFNMDGRLDFFDISALIAGYSAGCDPTGDC